MMRIRYFQHSRTEGIGLIRDWADERGFQVEGSMLHRGDPHPEVEEVDFLIVMGGPMNVYQHRDHPWLLPEKRFMARAIEQGKKVLGICLGAQLIADVSGAKVYQNPELEIGWLPVRLTEDGRGHVLFRDFPRELVALHWHGDTFDLPGGVPLLAESDACRHQAFAIGNKVAGLQFHLEAGRRQVDEFVEGVEEEIAPGRFVQKRSVIQNCDAYLPATTAALRSLLDVMAEAT